MKLSTCLTGIGVGVLLLASGCASMGRPRAGYLLYYDIADAGAIWCWEDHYGWRYLGEREFQFGPHHRPEPVHHRGDDHDHRPPGDDHKGPGDDHKKPGDDHGKPGDHHPGDVDHRPGDGHRAPPKPGEKPPPNSCYVFIGNDGGVLTSRDGNRFRTIGQVSDNGAFARHETAGVFQGNFNGKGDAFAVGSKPAGENHSWLGSVFSDRSRGNEGWSRGGSNGWSGGGGDRSISSGGGREYAGGGSSSGGGFSGSDYSSSSASSSGSSWSGGGNSDSGASMSSGASFSGGGGMGGTGDNTVGSEMPMHTARDN